MGASDKMDASMDKLKGKAKEATGKLTDNESMEAEGKLDQAKGDAKRAAENLKDTVKDVFKD